MRPKKTILLLDRDEIALSVRAFMLETKGFRVLQASSPDDAVAILQESRSIDCLVCDRNLLSLDGDDLVNYARMLHPGMTALLLGNHYGVMYANACLPKEESSPEAVLERLRILTARKRGPIKRAHELAMPIRLVAVA